MACIFCEYNENKDFIAENDLAIAIYDKYPVNEGHVLITHKRHYDDFYESTANEILDFYDLVHKVKTILNEKYKPDGYNIGINVGQAAGQTIFHLHIHIIPRYIGDVENPRGGVRKLKKALVEYDG